jgi:hypothetical protein
MVPNSHVYLPHVPAYVGGEGPLCTGGPPKALGPAGGLLLGPKLIWASRAATAAAFLAGVAIAAAVSEATGQHSVA